MSFLFLDKKEEDSDKGKERKTLPDIRGGPYVRIKAGRRPAKTGT